jgi:hypothetical protein
LIGFASISALLNYIGVSVGLLIERYGHDITYRVLLSNDDDDGNNNIEETLALTNEDDRDNDTEQTIVFQSDPLLTRIVRPMFQSCLTSIDTYLSPKRSAIILIIISLTNTLITAILVAYVFKSDNYVHVSLLSLGITIDFLIKFIFCLLRPKKQSTSLIFTCPAVPLVPLINTNIFIFLIILQDAHDWLAFVILLGFSLFIYFAYSYRHSKAR